jgi:hypothetical protein
MGEGDIGLHAWESADISGTQGFFLYGCKYVEVRVYRGQSGVFDGRFLQ